MGLNTSVTGLIAAQQGLWVAQHNIANANTEGYSRQSISQATGTGLGTGAGYFGNGTQVVTVKRQYDKFLTDQVNQAQNTLSALQSATSQMDVVDQMLGDTSSGISTAVADFYAGVQQVASFPSSTAARQSMVSAAQIMTERFNMVSGQVTNLSLQTDQQIRSTAVQLNDYANQLVELNRQIRTSAGYQQPPNDLLDKRDLVIANMNKLVNISITKTTNLGPSGEGNSYGNTQVYLGNGRQLVGDDQAYKVEARPSSQDPAQYSLYLNGLEVDNSRVTGGTLGGLFSFRTNILDTVKNTLGQIAYSIGRTFNAQHATGMDLQGNQGGDTDFVADFFSIPDTVSATPSDNTAPELTIALTAPALTSDNADGYYRSNLTNSDYTLKYDGTSYTLTRKTDGKVWSAGDIPSLNLLLTGSDDQGFTINTPVGNVPIDNTYLISPSGAMASKFSVDSRMQGDVRLVAAGLAVTSFIPTANTGDMTAVVVRMAQDPGNASATPGDPGTFVTTSTPMTITYNAGELTGFFNSGATKVVVTGMDGTRTEYTGDPIPYQAGAFYNVGGIVFSMKGVPKDKDTVILQRNDGATIGVSDSSNILLLNKQQTSKVVGGASTSSGTYAQMVSDVGNQAADYQSRGDSQKALLDMVRAARDNYSGVNLDEEAASLLQFQQFYQANSKALQTAKSIIDVLFSVIG